MNDYPKNQMPINNNTSDSTKRKFGDTFHLVWKDTIQHVVSELEHCLNPLREDTQKEISVCEVLDMLDILQSCTQKIELLVQIENEADRLRDLIGKKTEKNP